MVKTDKKLEEYRELASGHGGKLLSTKYTGSKVKYEWECSKGHHWLALGSNVKKGHWCPECAGRRRITIEDAQAHAKELGGLCLSEKYVNARTHLRWRCAEGHEWEAVPDSVMRAESWCPSCAGKKAYDLVDLQKIAEGYGGKLLSTEARGAHKLLKWRCADSHEWEATPSNVKNNGSWCPDCKYYKSEGLCRIAFEQIFQVPFPRKRPSWLLSKNGKRMELDGYNADLALAFEYHGIQHFKTHMFGSTEADLEKRKQADHWKREKCAQKGVTLVEIIHRDDLSTLPHLILDRLPAMSALRAKVDPSLKVDFSQHYDNVSLVRRASEAAATRGGKLLSKTIKNGKDRIRLQCSEGHVWTTVFEKIVNEKTWCPKCAGNTPLSIKEMQIIAAERGGKCLSDVYDGSQKHLTWQCAEGHTWSARASHVKRGSWCPKCGIANRARGRRLGIDFAKELAAKHNGQ